MERDRKCPGTRGLRARNLGDLGLACGDESGALDIPTAAEPVVAPVPPPVLAVEVPDVLAAVPNEEALGPEEDVAGAAFFVDLVGLRNEVRVEVEGLTDVGMVADLLLHLRLQVLAVDDAFPLLFAEVEGGRAVDVQHLVLALHRDPSRALAPGPASLGVLEGQGAGVVEVDADRRFVDHFEERDDRRRGKRNAPTAVVEELQELGDDAVDLVDDELEHPTSDLRPRGLGHQAGDELHTLVLGHGFACWVSVLTSAKCGGADLATAVRAQNALTAGANRIINLPQKDHFVKRQKYFFD